LLKSKGIITVKFGKLQAEINLYPLSIKRLLSNKTAQEIFEKRMLQAIK